MYSIYSYNINYYAAASFLQHFEILDNYTKLLNITQENINLIKI